MTPHDRETLASTCQFLMLLLEADQETCRNLGFLGHGSFKRYPPPQKVTSLSKVEACDIPGPAVEEGRKEGSY